MLTVAVFFFQLSILTDRRQRRTSAVVERIDSGLAIVCDESTDGHRSRHRRPLPHSGQADAGSRPWQRTKSRPVSEPAAARRGASGRKMWFERYAPKDAPAGSVLTWIDQEKRSMIACDASFALEAFAAPVHDMSELESVVAAHAREPN